jgi:hypothetical protein
MGIKLKKSGTIDTEPGFFGGDGEGGCTRDPTDVVRWSGPINPGPVDIFYGGRDGIEGYGLV